MTDSPLAVESVGDGPPVVLLHAFPYDRAMWGPQRSLASRCRLLLPDLPGFGDTPAGEWTVDAAADRLAAGLDAVGVTGAVAVGGLSMGGYVALAFARRHPQRLRALILADTRAEPDSPEAKAGRTKTAEVAKGGGAAAVFDDVVAKQLSEYTRSRRPEVVAAARQIASRQSVEGVIAALAALRDRPEARPDLAAIAVPTLVLVGSDDAITPPAAARVLADGIPGATLQEVPTAGHLSNLETPAEFTAAVRSFLAGL